MSASCPQETFIISVALRQVSALSSRTEQELTENFSAKEVIGGFSKVGQQCDDYLPFFAIYRGSGILIDDGINSIAP